ncbi:MAG: sigma 54-interacting transcriptional regulator [Candidatus Hydrogenedentes bacterium]|nr:sigma 54-interacting transcriptional regulator [Candidatus Hydrogenedentota bacterium]
MNPPNSLPNHLHKTFGLRMIAGPSIGTQWRITSPLTAIGRAIGCHIHIDDPHVSRVQCEILHDTDGLRLRSKGQQNPTYINDRICDESVLSPGDVISFAGVMLILDVAQESPVPVDTADHQTTRSFADSIELRAQLDPDAYLQDPRLATRTRGLLGFLRALGQTESLEALIDRLQSHVVERLYSEKCWVGWRRDVRGPMVLLPPESPESTANAPFEVMEECVASETGIIVSAPAGANRIIAAPLTHGGESFGAIIARRPASANEFAEYDLKYLVILAESCAPLLRAAERLEQLRRDADAAFGGRSRTAQILGSSPAIQALKAELRSAAIARVNVMIQGETGVGKELAARAIHDLSARASGPYVVVNCAAIAPGLFESELFGHERGAFTGAIRKRKGLFEQAQGGTLFLDEVAELGLPNQALLLRAVETGAFRPVGSEKELQVDVRVICATNRPLPDTSNTYFRADLYHRLAGIVIRIKPLRERKEDILELAGSFLSAAAPHAPNHPKGLAQDAIDKLREYDWPGNARELRNVVERACFVARTSIVTRQDIQIDGVVSSATSPTGVVSLDDIERRHLLDMLSQHRNNVPEVARLLGISRSTLYYKLSQHGIKPRDLTT